MFPVFLGGRDPAFHLPYPRVGEAGWRTLCRFRFQLDHVDFGAGGRCAPQAYRKIRVSVNETGTAVGRLPDEIDVRRDRSCFARGIAEVDDDFLLCAGASLFCFHSYARTSDRPRLREIAARALKSYRKPLTIAPTTTGTDLARNAWILRSQMPGPKAIHRKPLTMHRRQ
jgi:hypothetical protein